MTRGQARRRAGFPNLSVLLTLWAVSLSCDATGALGVEYDNSYKQGAFSINVLGQCILPSPPVFA